MKTYRETYAANLKDVFGNLAVNTRADIGEFGKAGINTSRADSDVDTAKAAMKGTGELSEYQQWDDKTLDMKVFRYLSKTNGTYFKELNDEKNRMAAAKKTSLDLAERAEYQSKTRELSQKLTQLKNYIIVKLFKRITYKKTAAKYVFYDTGSDKTTYDQVVAALQNKLARTNDQRKVEGKMPLPEPKSLVTFKAGAQLYPGEMRLKHTRPSKSRYIPDDDFFTDTSGFADVDEYTLKTQYFGPTYGTAKSTQLRVGDKKYAQVPSSVTSQYNLYETMKDTDRLAVHTRGIKNKIRYYLARHLGPDLSSRIRVDPDVMDYLAIQSDSAIDAMVHALVNSYLQIESRFDKPKPRILAQHLQHTLESTAGKRYIEKIKFTPRDFSEVQSNYSISYDDDDEQYQGIRSQIQPKKKRSLVESKGISSGELAQYLAYKQEDTIEKAIKRDYGAFDQTAVMKWAMKKAAPGGTVGDLAGNMGRKAWDKQLARWSRSYTNKQGRVMPSGREKMIRRLMEQGVTQTDAESIADNRTLQGMLATFGNWDSAVTSTAKLMDLLGTLATDKASKFDPLAAKYFTPQGALTPAQRFARKQERHYQLSVVDPMLFQASVFLLMSKAHIALTAAAFLGVKPSKVNQLGAEAEARKSLFFTVAKINDELLKIKGLLRSEIEQYKDDHNDVSGRSYEYDALLAGFDTGYPSLSIAYYNGYPDNDFSRNLKSLKPLAAYDQLSYRIDWRDYADGTLTSAGVLSDWDNLIKTLNTKAMDKIRSIYQKLYTSYKSEILSAIDKGSIPFPDVGTQKEFLYALKQPIRIPDIIIFDSVRYIFKAAGVPQAAQIATNSPLLAYLPLDEEYSHAYQEFENFGVVQTSLVQSSSESLLMPLLEWASKQEHAYKYLSRSERERIQEERKSLNEGYRSNLKKVAGKYRVKGYERPNFNLQELQTLY